MKTAELRARTTALLDRLADRLPPDRMAQYREYAFVGEWAMLVDELAAGLVRRRVPVTEDEREALREILYSFRVPAPDHRHIENRDEVMASLTPAG